ALASYDRAIALRPRFAEAHHGRGNALNNLNRLEEALATYDTAIGLRPDYAEALVSRGNALMKLTRHRMALASYDQAIGLRPDYAEAHFGRGLCLLQLGDLPGGWTEHEWRWQTTRDRGMDLRRFREPPWLGDVPVAGRRILLHAEQGFGDTLQFCRYV